MPGTRLQPQPGQLARPLEIRRFKCFQHDAVGMAQHAQHRLVRQTGKLATKNVGHLPQIVRLQDGSPPAIPGRYAGDVLDVMHRGGNTSNSGRPTMASRG